ncbi:MAG: hypothetical protein GAK43_00612 [Stenotrophomonas maltophilia]|nr:MAG: hypothetical protein GAK43_00612 [Stenotrophomonas maltophilia]
MPLDGELERNGAHFRLLPIEDAQTLAPLGLIQRRSAPRSALAQACFDEARLWLGLLQP